jgi:hypothetical protein
MLLDQGLGSRQFPELRDGGVVHPAVDEREIALWAHGGEVEDACGCPDRPPAADTVEQVVPVRNPARVPGRGPARVPVRSPGRVPVPRSGAPGEQRDQFVGEAQVERVLAVRAGAGFRAGARAGSGAGSGFESGGAGGNGVGARIGGRHGDAPLRRRVGHVPQE